MKTRHRYALLCVALLSLTAFTFGGWAVVSVDDMPEHLVVGKPTKLSFIVRGHGVSPLDDLKPRVTLKSGSNSVSASVRPDTKRGYYYASLVAPSAGDWSVRIETGFGPAQLNLVPTKAITAGNPVPTISEVERGHRLFNAKGCVSCHVRSGEGSENYKFGPDLTGRSFPAEVLTKFLKDPLANPIRSVPFSEIKMPQLELKDREIASLVAYINSSKQLSLAK